MEENKVYKIADIKFNLKTDLELDESTEISSLLKGLYAESSNVVAGKFTGEDMKKFLSIVLEPIDGKLPEDFSFGRTKESVQLEVFKDFFLDRIKRAGAIAGAFADSMQQQQEP